MSDLLLPADFQLLFEAMPHPYLILRPDEAFTIVAVNDRYLLATGTVRSAIVGHGLFKIFPDNPDDQTGSGVSDLRASLNRVLTARCQDVMGVQKYDIPRRDGSGEFEVKYWSPVNTPVLGPDGDLRFIAHHVEDVTEFILGRERAKEENAEWGSKVEARAERSEAEVWRRAAEVKETNRALKSAMEELKRREEELAELNRQLEEQDRLKDVSLALALDRLNAHIENSPLAIIEFDSGFTVTRWSKTAEHLFGWQAEEIVGRSIPEIRWVHDEDVEAVARVSAEMLSGTSPRNKSTNRNFRKDGSIVHCEWYNSAIYDREGNLVSILSQVLDITDRVEGDRKIERLNADLEQRVAQRTAELVAANRELEGFTFATSHDLKGPLGRINMFSTMLERDYRDRLEGDGLLFLGIIRQNATRLMELVDDLLSHARISQQVLELQNIDVQAAVETVLQEKLEDMREMGAKIQVNLPPAQVLADSHAFSQALGNLIENALKYSSNAVSSLVEIGGESVEDRFRLWVQDNGIGFKMEYHDKIFQIFKRLHTHAEYTGSGVGLALVQRAMERMGGKVWAESSPGQGATFFLEFQTAGSAEG